MAIFNSYVSLPEGNLGVAFDVFANCFSDLVLFLAPASRMVPWGEDLKKTTATTCHNRSKNSNSNSNDDNDKKKATDKTKTYRNEIGKHDGKMHSNNCKKLPGKTFKNPKQKVDLQLQNIANAAQQGLDWKRDE